MKNRTTRTHDINYGFADYAHTEWDDRPHEDLDSGYGTTVLPDENNALPSENPTSPFEANHPPPP